MPDANKIVFRAEARVSNSYINNPEAVSLVKADMADVLSRTIVQDPRFLTSKVDGSGTTFCLTVWALTSEDFSDLVENIRQRVTAGKSLLDIMPDWPGRSQKSI